MATEWNYYLQIPTISCMKVKLKMFLVTILSKNKETVDFSKYYSKSKYYDEANTLVVGKTTEEMGGFASEEFVRLKPKMYSTLVSNSDEYKKARGVNKNVVAKISHIEFKDLLFKNFLSHSVNGI